MTELSELPADTAVGGEHLLGRRDEFESTPVDPRVRRQVHRPEVLVGPVDSATVELPACPTCVARRWQALRPENLREALEGATTPSAIDPRGVVNPFAAVTVAAVEQLSPAVARTRAGRHSLVVAIDTETMRVSCHSAIADPECQSCGALPADAATDLPVPRVPKADRWDFRGRSIFDYRLDRDGLVGPVCGALGPRTVHDLTSTTTSATIGCFTTRSGSYLREVFWGGHDDSFEVSARVGLLEGLERVAGMRPRGRRTAMVAAYDELTAPAVDPRDCGLYDDAFHAANPWVAPFDPAAPIAWVWGHSLRDDRPILVPEVLTYYHISGQHRRFVQESSSGCATGGSVTEAALFGLLELIERDAFVIGWYAGKPLPEIDPRSVRSGLTRATVARLELAGYRARFFDARVSFEVPVVLAVAERADGGLGSLCFGAGASYDPESAVASALCEIATDAPNSRRRSSVHHERLRAMVDDLDRVLSLHDHPLLYGLPEMRHHADFLLRQGPAPRSMRQTFELDRPAPTPAEDLRTDLFALVDELAGRGLDTIVVDQTMAAQRSADLHTVSVLAPGLVPVDFGWSRQRARRLDRTRTARFDAGLDAAPLTADQLTPAPHPLP